MPNSRQGISNSSSSEIRLKSLIKRLVLQSNPQPIQRRNHTPILPQHDLPGIQPPKVDLRGLPSHLRVEVPVRWRQRGGHEVLPVVKILRLVVGDELGVLQEGAVDGYGACGVGGFGLVFDGYSAGLEDPGVVSVALLVWEIWGCCGSL